MLQLLGLSIDDLLYEDFTGNLCDAVAKGIKDPSLLVNAPVELIIKNPLDIEATFAGIFNEQKAA